LDPRGLVDRYADYWQQNRNHARIHHLHGIHNPHRHPGYGPDCWGLTSSHGPRGYRVSSPASDTGLVAPTAALSSFPYLPVESMRALRYFLTLPQRRISGRFGFIDAFAPGDRWFARTYLAIDQGPIIAMIENHRSGLLWNLFMSAPEIRSALARLGFASPHLQAIAEPKPV
ncbi:MAG: glucoamylase family protein, partial [Alphaproteobacteria bacterium]